MKKTSLLILIIICSMISMDSFAQKNKNVSKSGHEITFNIKHASDSILYLAIHYREKLILKDSVRPTSKEHYILKGDNLYEDGLYTLVSDDRVPYLNFIIDNNQFFTYNLDTTGDVKKFSVINSPENSEMLSFQQKTVDAQLNAAHWSEKVSTFEKEKNSDSASYYKEKLKLLNDEMTTFINNLIDRNPNFLFSKMQKAYQQIDIPALTMKADSTPDYEKQAAYYRTHFWDNFDLSDHRFIYLPVFEPKVKEYFNKILYYQDTDTINKYVDMVIAKAESDTLMYRYFIDWLSYQFESSKVIGHDAVFVHIAKTNQLAGKCNWIDEDLLSKYQKRIKRMEPLLIGQQSVELVIPDTSLTDDYSKWHSSYKMPKKYVILWFYDPDCPTCKKESAKLRTVYDSVEAAGTRNFDVYAVGNDADIDRWKKYVKEQNYPWLNVGGNKANVDYLEIFNIHETGNPAMFILNEKREIILNRRIEMANIPAFLEQYEKMVEYKKSKQ